MTVHYTNLRLMKYLKLRRLSRGPPFLRPSSYSKAPFDQSAKLTSSSPPLTLDLYPGCVQVKPWEGRGLVIPNSGGPTGARQANSA